ncbi:MAG: ABC transporter permease subunit [Desulfurococcales archaeon]|nr:ABC transporter permease subunit [Desulfurococcales archaeon]
MVTLEILTISMPISVLLGIALGTARVYGNVIIRGIASAIVITFRGFPVLVTLLLIFFGLSDFGIYVPPFWTAVIGFILCSGSYQSEYVRGAIRSIDIGQSLAARSIGMTKFQEVLYIILPQAVRRAFLGITNELIYLVQYSSLAFVVGVPEMFAVTKTFNSLYFRPVETFTTLAVVYLVMISVLVIFFRGIERRLAIPGIEITTK